MENIKVINGNIIEYKDKHSTRFIDIKKAESVEIQTLCGNIGVCVKFKEHYADLRYNLTEEEVETKIREILKKPKFR